MKIAVLVKEVPDTYRERRIDPDSWRVDRASDEQVIDEIDERALEVALRYKDADKAAEVVAIAMGPDGARANLRKALAMGADRAVLIADEMLVGADALGTAKVLAAVLRAEDPDLVLAGNESTDGAGGVIPAIVAELLGIALLGNVRDVEIDERGVRAIRATATYRATLTATLPAIVSVTEQAPEARFPNFKGVMAAKKKPLETVDIAAIGVEGVAVRTRLRSVAERPARAGGRVIVPDERAGEVIVDFLRERKAI